MRPKLWKKMSKHPLYQKYYRICSNYPNNPWNTLEDFVGWMESMGWNPDDRAIVTKKLSFDGSLPDHYNVLINEPSKLQFYHNWTHLIDRCYNDRNPSYPRYGGRGIKVCDEWMNFPSFKEWAELSGLEAGKCIHRIDNDGNYSPENCRILSIEEHTAIHAEARKGRPGRKKGPQSLEHRRKISDSNKSAYRRRMGLPDDYEAKHKTGSKLSKEQD